MVSAIKEYDLKNNPEPEPVIEVEEPEPEPVVEVEEPEPEPVVEIEEAELESDLEDKMHFGDSLEEDKYIDEDDL